MDEREPQEDDGVFDDWRHFLVLIDLNAVMCNARICRNKIVLKKRRQALKERFMASAGIN